MWMVFLKQRRSLRKYLEKEEKENPRMNVMFAQRDFE